MEMLRDLWLTSKRLARTVAGRDLFIGRQVRIPSEHHGTRYGGWTICPRGIGRDSIVYSFGVGEDISFDLSIIGKYGLTVHAFDPTPRSMEWVKRQAIPGQFVFHDLGLADFDGTARFAPPEDPTHVSYRVAARPPEQAAMIEAQVRRLSTIMGMLGHQAIDILKIDIEGSEYGAIEDILRGNIPISQFLIEFHHCWVGVEKTRRAIRRLNEHGYRIFSVSPGGAEFSFIRQP